jgi:poly-gamma-glutamate capsule biosynthesis protein CapA/YwtB (metallophosphatase superfamily)
MKQKFFFLLIFSVFFFGLFTFFNYPSQQFNNDNNLAIKTPSRSLFQTILPEKTEPITIIAVGDIMLGRAVNARMQKNNDFLSPFILTADFLKSADLTFGNLESPFFDKCKVTNEGMTFCADYKAIEGLKFAGFDVLNLANNHILNYGKEGLNQTLNLLNQNKIVSVYQDPQIITIKNSRLGFLSFNLLLDNNENKILETVKELKKKADIVIISLHWGNEYQVQPPQSQINLAHKIIDSGVDLIVGHHPHVIQPTEEYKGKLILYSLGNFVFDQPWSEPTKKGLVAKITFEKNKITKTEYKQIYIKNLIQPEFTEAAAK